MGIRYNGQNLDLNRDGMKLESPEASGLVENVFLRWDPVFFLDSHTHNGSYHQEPVTWTWGLNPNGDPGIFSYMADVVLPEITRRTREDYGLLTIPHGDFIDASDPGAGWIPLGPQPRYLSNYVGLRNRLSVLNEQYPYVDFETRVMGAYNLFRTFLDYLYDNKEEVVAPGSGCGPEDDGAGQKRVTRGVRGGVRCTGHRLHDHHPGLRDGGHPDRGGKGSGPTHRNPTHVRRCALPGELGPDPDGALAEWLSHHGSGSRVSWRNSSNMESPWSASPSR